MSIVRQIEKWSSTHNPKWLVFIRVVLGLCLFIKGVSFLNNISYLQQLLERSGISMVDNNFWIAPIITWIHILGGALIIVGLFTRMAIVAQIPIVAGAIVLINSKNGIFAGQSDLIFSIVVLLLLLFFFVEGGGQISMDNYVKRHLL